VSRRRRVVIVGAAAAGFAAAEGLRRAKFDGPITIVGEQSFIDADRPPLSKQILAGEWQADEAILIPNERLRRIDADLRLGRRAVALDQDAREVTLDDGTAVGYDDLIVSTGVRPRVPATGLLPGMRVLRTLADSTDLGEAIRAGGRLVVIGAGFLGLEVAATARRLGASVTVIEPMAQPLANRVGAIAAQRLLARHLAEGVDLRCCVGVERFEPGPAGAVTTAHLTDGTRVHSPVVLVAIGSEPNVDWLRGSRLALGDGLECDEFCRAAPGVWGAGDVAKWLHVGFGRSMRIEHRMNATEQGIAVAGNIVAEDPRPFCPMPFFWTDHYDVKVQVAGQIAADASESVEQVGDASWLHRFEVSGELVGVLGWNAAREMMPLRRELNASVTAAVARAGR
jgi:3-phenylpropionate/trans-cinnamate dioxygenase ferredoxin reductase subunit